MGVSLDEDPNFPWIALTSDSSKSDEELLNAESHGSNLQPDIYDQYGLSPVNNESGANGDQYDYDYNCSMEDKFLEEMKSVFAPSQIVVPSIYCLVCLIGLLGNGLVIFVIVGSKEMTKSVANIYILNLAVADTLLLLALPFSATQRVLLAWPFGVGMCKIVEAIKYLSYFASINFLTAMSVDRYFAVVHVVKASRYRTNKNTYFICLLVWILSFSMIIPLLIYTKIQGGIHHVVSPSFHPASNGEAERFVQTLKSGLRKNCGGGEKVASALQNLLATYRCTPHPSIDWRTPAEVLHGRQPRNLLSLCSPIDAWMRRTTIFLPELCALVFVSSESSGKDQHLEMYYGEYGPEDSDCYQSYISDYANMFPATDEGNSGDGPDNVLAQQLQLNKTMDQLFTCRHPNSKHFHRFIIVTFVLGFIIPFGIITISYAMIVAKLLQPSESRSRSRQADRTRRKVTRMVVALVVTFFVCWLPFNVWHMIMIKGIDMNWEHCHNVRDFTFCLGFANSCLNPLLYTFLGHNFQDRLRRSISLSVRPFTISTFSRYTSNTLSRADTAMHTKRMEATNTEPAGEAAPRVTQTPSQIPEEEVPCILSDANANHELAKC